MHGVRLQPGSTVIELLVRLFNRSDEPQTFLWWANVAAEVHADYQSFFPSDVTVVADHAKRALSTFPAATGHLLRHRLPGPPRPGHPGRQLPPGARGPAGLAAQHSGTDLLHVPGFVPGLLRRLRPPGRRRLRALGRPPLRRGQEAVDLGRRGIRARVGGQPGRRRLDLHRTDGRGLHRQPARLLPSRAGGNQDVQPVLVSRGRNRAGRRREPRCRARRRGAGRPHRATVRRHARPRRDHLDRARPGRPAPPPVRARPAPRADGVGGARHAGTDPGRAAARRARPCSAGAHRAAPRR